MKILVQVSYIQTSKRWVEVVGDAGVDTHVVAMRTIANLPPSERLAPGPLAEWSYEVLPFYVKDNKQP